MKTTLTFFLILFASTINYAQFSSYFNRWGSGNIVAIYESNSEQSVLSASNKFYVKHDTTSTWTERLTTVPSIRAYSSYKYRDTLLIGGIALITQSNNNRISEIAHYPFSGSNRVTSLNVIDRIIYAGTNGIGLYQKHLDSANWSPVGFGLPSALTIHTIEQIDSTTYLGTSNGIYTSPKNSLNWTLQSTNIPPSLQVYSIKKHQNSNKLFIGTNGGLYTSTNKGATMSRDSNIPQNVTIEHMDYLGDTIFITGSSDFTFFSSNNGNNWNNISLGLPPNAAVTCLQVANNNLYVACWGILYKFDGITFVKEDTDLTDSELSIFPNPAKDKIKISGLTEANDIQVTIYGNDGKLIKSTKNHHYLEELDVSELVDGVYFIHIVQDNSLFTVRFVKI